MNSNTKNECDGALSNAARSVKANPTDCSHWEADIPAEQWSTGELVNVARSVPPVVVECSTWNVAPAVWLELVVSFDDGTDVAGVEVLTTKLVQAAHDAAPELGLTYDPDRSRVSGEDVIVALTPRIVAGAEDRLGAVIRRVREVVATTRQLALTSAGLRWAG